MPSNKIYKSDEWDTVYLAACIRQFEIICKKITNLTKKFSNILFSKTKNLFSIIKNCTHTTANVELGIQGHWLWQRRVRRNGIEDLYV